SRSFQLPLNCLCGAAEVNQEDGEWWPKPVYLYLTPRLSVSSLSVSLLSFSLPLCLFRQFLDCFCVSTAYLLFILSRCSEIYAIFNISTYISADFSFFSNIFASVSSTGSSFLLFKVYVSSCISTTVSINK
ncbi:hypothetical protein XENORESO_011079, partial [Xenotaenia resolanae]